MPKKKSSRCSPNENVIINEPQVYEPHMQKITVQKSAVLLHTNYYPEFHINFSRFQYTLVYVTKLVIIIVTDTITDVFFKYFLPV